MNARAMGHAELQNAHFTTGRLPVSPSRESFSASGRPAAASTTRNVSQNQHFFSSRGSTAAASNGRSSIGNSHVAARPGNGGSNSNSPYHRSSQGSETRGNANTGSARAGNSTGARASGGSKAAGRDFRRWPRAHLLSQGQAGRVNRPAAVNSAVRTGLRAVRLQQAVATDQAATAGHLVRHSI